MALWEHSSSEEATALAKLAATRPEDPAAPGRFGKVTVAALAVGVVGAVVSVVVSLNAASGSPLAIGAVVAAAVLGVVGLAGFLKLLGEALGPSPSGRTTPERAVNAYLTSASRGRWHAAACCLSWVAKQGDEAVRPAMPELDLEEEARVAVSGEEGLAEYWGVFTGTGLALRGRRRMSGAAKRVKMVSRDAAVVQAEVDISLDLRTAVVGGEACRRKGAFDDFNRAVAACRWPVYRRDGLWYVLYPGFAPNVKIVRSD